ncbi:hypothetical protein DICPUDRAFT_97354 [Dictyostelium purpureum]|uniref:4-hydroxyphenylpyruvate dioxygenase n=1 Tax=Dictyostelium purpureum TaxID=5786 RepID=F0ZG03_DICPU|nr:uncharacterized protein DICPUDRAFT_97354 [Dictyostelium purpureum]EGC37153.1 hypothetical protein DICPUDRAFT_97354 [Dictyostelium purpureum]|eukprot:XP_003286356.1 hypothetical protein DICPUDRAFT_97354 [Dictyostelium purpureum]
MENKESKLGYLGFDYVNLYVGNALQAASYYITKFGFQNLAYKGLKHGDRRLSTHVVKQNNIVIAFTTSTDKEDSEFSSLLQKHGDSIKEIAFTVEDCKFVYDHAISKGAVSIKAPHEISDERGTVVMATIATPVDDVVHVFVERKNFKGAFLPGFTDEVFQDPMSNITGPVNLQLNDHIVYCLESNEMDKFAQWYYDVLGFHRYWSADESIVHTKYSSLNSTVVADFNTSVKLVINEGVNTIKKSQVQEFVDFAGRGCQHFALVSTDIIDSIEKLVKRGVQFMPVPKTYYSQLKSRLSQCSIEVKEDINKLQELNIFLDFDEDGYLLQIFTKTVEDRPTMIIEVIQRVGHNFGFGAGNFKAIFKAIETEQKQRGNL